MTIHCLLTVLFQFLVFSVEKLYWLLYSRSRLLDCRTVLGCTVRINITNLTLCRYIKLILIPLCKDSLILAKLLGIGQMLVRSSRDDRSCSKLSNSSCCTIGREETLWSDLVSKPRPVNILIADVNYLSLITEKRKRPLKKYSFDLPSIQLEFKENFWTTLENKNYFLFDNLKIENCI